MEKIRKSTTTEKSSSKTSIGSNQDILARDSKNVTNNSNNVDTEPENAANAKLDEIVRKPETIDDLKAQLTILMNSIATLSAEKSRMEANFQTDRRQLRAERDEHEKTIKDLKDKLKRTQHNTHSEVEHVKYKLIMERHEREKEQGDNSAMIKELQKLLTDERFLKETLEQQLKDLKSQVANKTQNKILEAELDMANQRLKQAEAAVKETPPILVSLQAEMITLRKQHRNAIHEERKRAAAAEQQAKTLEMVHESRVAGLEARLAELSETVGDYHRVRQQDQYAIQKLKDQLYELQNKHELRTAMDMDYTQDECMIATKIQELYTRLLDLNSKKNDPINVQTLLKSLNLHDDNQNFEYKKKYDVLQQEFETYKQQMEAKLFSISKDLQTENKHNDNTTLLQRAKSYNKNLEERIRMLNKEISHKDNELKIKFTHYTQQIQEERIKFDNILSQKETEYRGKIGSLEHQLLRQRERSFALIAEKDQEITTLKSSFRTIMMKKDNNIIPSILEKTSTSTDKQTEPVADFVTSLLTFDSSPLLHYAQELARREIQVTGLRKQNSELESLLRENHRDLLATNQRHADEIKTFETKITRLEAYKYREGANLEYLKNVFVNYLTSTDSSSRRHMLNAIATVLRFTSEEIEKIQRLK